MCKTEIIVTESVFLVSILITIVLLFHGEKFGEVVETAFC